MTDPHEDRLRQRLGAGVPEQPGQGDLARLAATVEQRARRRRTTRRAGMLGAAVLAVVVAVVVPLAWSGGDGVPAADSSTSAPVVTPPTTPPTTPATGGVDAPDACVPLARADRTGLDGTPVWARFCPGRDGYTTPAAVPSDALVSHLDRLAGLGVDPPGRSGDLLRCGSFGRTYRLQIGYADGSVAQVAGRTDPGCRGRLAGGADPLRQVRGPAGLGVYGTVMAAFGQQYADGFDTVAPSEPLSCPPDPRDPGSVERDGASSSLETGYLLGDREPLRMALPAVRGIVCTWSPDAPAGTDPTVRELSAEDAERVRIGLHAVAGGVVDCGGSPDPTHTAVVEDETGTRRAITIIDSECSTVVQTGSYARLGGLGFAWLER